MNRPRRYLTGLRAMIVLVACCAVISWAGREVWQPRDPLLTEALAIQGHALRSLQSPNAPKRLAAIHDLAQLDLADNVIAIPPLIETLKDKNPEARAASAQALGRIAGDAVRNGSNPKTVRTAVTALKSLFKDPQPEIRIAAVYSLAAIASAEAGAGTVVSAAPAASAGKSVPSVPATKVATPIDKATLIAALTEALGDRDASVRVAAVVALAAADSAGAPSVKPPRSLAVILEDESAENRKVVLCALVRYRCGLDSWIPSLLRIAEHDNDHSVRAAYRKTIAGEIQPRAITSAAVPDLIAGLRSRDWQLRISITNLLGNLGNDADAAIPSLLGILLEPIDEEQAHPRHERENLGWAAAFAIGRIEPKSVSTPEVMTALTKLVRSGHPSTKGPAALLLSNLGPDAAPAIPVLIDMARNAGANHAYENEVAAAQALGLIAPDTPAGDEVVTFLLAVLESTFAPSRATAIEALERLGPKAAIAIPKIRALRDDPDFRVRQTASKALAVLEAPK